MTTRTPSLRIDLNGDLGEWDSTSPEAWLKLRADEDLMESLTSVNIACGGHAGDEGSMRLVVRSARDRGLGVGAHPGFNDRDGFGRRPIPLPPAAVATLVGAQLAALRRIASEEGARIVHVKPHGALYTLAAADEGLAGAIAGAVARIDSRLVLVGLSGSALLDAGHRAGLGTASEVFCDRGYTATGTLVPRGESGGLLSDAVPAAGRLLRMIRSGRVFSRDGVDLPIVADTACIHGDQPGAAAFARRVRSSLEEAGVVVERLKGPAVE